MIQRISTPSRTKQIIEQNKFSFKKGFGQNFLIDTNILEKIAQAAKVTKQDCVLEIGPGIGSLTQILAEQANKVIAVEIDKMLIPILKETLKDYSNIEIIHEDILKLNLQELIEQKNENKPIKVVANLPYYITTPILIGLLEKKLPCESITVMVQKEVAERMQAQPNTKDYGALSIAVGYYCKAHIDFIVPPSCFMPQPKVGSAVITLDIQRNPSVFVENQEFFFHIVKCAFGQRRKTLCNCLLNQAKLGFNRIEISELLQKAGLTEKVRGESLSIEQFAALSNLLWQAKPQKLV